MKVLIAGDFCDNGRVTSLIANGDYSTIFSEVKPIIESVDYSLVNFEFPIVEGNGSPINKIGVCLRGQKESVDAIKYAGFKCATLANNHILDQGENCCLETAQLLKNSGIDTVGIGRNKDEANKVLYKKIDNKTLAIINCCEHEFSIAGETTAGANALSPIQQYYSIREAKENAEYVLVVVHGGHEHYQLPSPRMKELYRFFIDLGADAVVNHHQHCYSGYERYKGKPIFYGIGNFCFDSSQKMKAKWYEGFLVSIDFSNNFTFDIYPYKQCKEEPSIKFLTKDEYLSFQNTMNRLNKIIDSEISLEHEYNKWIMQGKHSVECLISPFTNHFLRRFALKKWLPSFVGDKRKTEILAYIQCESHRDRLMNILRQ